MTSDVLFGQLMVNVDLDAVFLEQLEPEMLNDRLPVIPPSIMQQLVSHYEESVYFERLEQCLCHVQVTCLDLHQVLTLCQNQGLHRAYLYVYTRALNDYVTPLEELMKQLRQAVLIGELQVAFHIFDL